MAEEKRNLCAQIPLSLHTRVRQEQEASGQTLGQYMTWLIQTFYEKQEDKNMNTDKRTVAFQVPGELFEKFKDYLQERGIKQNAFFLDCIHRALAEAQEEREAAEASAEPGSGQETDAAGQDEDAEESGTAE